ncbi:hypothetical protein RFI_16171 [Reticulomyxa filosa]|uniref:Chorein N-terminal domain-containing protein n=1 Tax=Reticulomyxa filosa TaxID=46433 RepID=X6N6V4_RETFI|nr:hypothetical protein RFI_23594 [Reticulomyxa filosa]ETO21032.1 hypothetical protein RFI_16171 [Reticulomyxa filosa]|eukprot:ETO13772.1 hypothetical protein RFI_23594 [Reticulomyxa filosa]
MSNIVVEKLSGFLSKVIKNYSKKQLDVSLIKGSVQLKDFGKDFWKKSSVGQTEIDVNVVNIYMESYVPFLEVTKLKVSDVTVQLPNYVAIKKNATVVKIGQIEMECIQRDFSKPKPSGAETSINDLSFASGPSQQEEAT